MKQKIIFILLLITMSHLYAQVEFSESEGVNLDTVEFNNRMYKLTFYDEFESLDLDNNKWSRDKEKERSNLHGFWRNNCVYQEDGALIIECRRSENGELQSGGINTKNLFAQNQGLFEISFKVTKGSALWYAFWLNMDGMFKHHEKKDSAEEGFELDIFEILPEKNIFSTGLHYGGYEYWDNKLITKSRQIKIDDSFYETYHKVQLCWNEDGYTIYLDGNFLYQLKSKNCGGVCLEDAYIELSAEFGTWGGDLHEETLPAFFYVDYIKVYKEI